MAYMPLTKLIQPFKKKKKKKNIFHTLEIKKKKNVVRFLCLIENVGNIFYKCPIVNNYFQCSRVITINKLNYLSFFNIKIKLMKLMNSS